MNRYCFVLHLRPELAAEYAERHAAVWPEMLHALADAGWHNYSLYAGPGDLVIGYVESEDLDAAQAAMASTEVNARWQQEMSRFFVGLDGRGPDEGLQLLPELFHLEDQLAEHLATQVATQPATQPATQVATQVATQPATQVATQHATQHADADQTHPPHPERTP